jgi:hypothetical protein
VFLDCFSIKLSEYFGGEGGTRTHTPTFVDEQFSKLRQCQLCLLLQIKKALNFYKSKASSIYIHYHLWISKVKLLRRLDDNNVFIIVYIILLKCFFVYFLLQRYEIILNQQTILIFFYLLFFSKVFISLVIGSLANVLPSLVSKIS